MVRIEINLKWPELKSGQIGPCYRVKIDGITEEYEECNMFSDRLDLYLSDRLVRRIILNDAFEIETSFEVEEYWSRITH